MKKTDFSDLLKKEIFVKELLIPTEKLSEEELKSIYYCDLADSQL